MSSAKTKTKPYTKIYIRGKFLPVKNKKCVCVLLLQEAMELKGEKMRRGRGREREGHTQKRARKRGRWRRRVEGMEKNGKVCRTFLSCLILM